MNVNVRGLALKSGRRLVNHDSRVRECEAAHAGFDELHGVVDRHASGHRAAWGINVQTDVFVGVFRF